VLDTLLYRREFGGAAPPSPPAQIAIRGGVNLLLIALIVVLIVLSAAWTPGFALHLHGVTLTVGGMVRDIGLVGIALLSLWLTPNEHREENGFTWAPMREVAALFAAIFVAIAPVLAMLQAGRDGAFGPLLALVTEADGRPREVAYFWLTGLLSAFLDNAPTYLVFFELAGGDAEALMGPFAGALAAISMGAVYMGALTYVGNAPNLMVYAIAEERGVRMPSFFGYLLIASLILLPIFVLLTLLPVAPVIASS
jgi:Na+/H+ antiporter NhaD/arsenite permease-like protein